MVVSAVEAMDAAIDAGADAFLRKPIDPAAAGLYRPGPAPVQRPARRQEQPMSDGRLRSGYQPLDEVLGGGLPGNGISIIMGLPGTGKTIIAQQYTFTNGRPDRPAVYFSTLSEPLEKIIRFGQTLEFFDAAAVGRSVFYEDLGQVAGRDGLAGVGDHVAAVLKQRRPGLSSHRQFQGPARPGRQRRGIPHVLAPAGLADRLPGRVAVGRRIRTRRGGHLARVRRGRRDHRTGGRAARPAGKTVPAHPEATRQRLPVRPARLPAHLSVGCACSPGWPTSPPTAATRSTAGGSPPGSPAWTP